MQTSATEQQIQSYNCRPARKAAGQLMGNSTIHT